MTKTKCTYIRSTDDLVKFLIKENIIDDGIRDENNDKGFYIMQNEFWGAELKILSNKAMGERNA